MREQKAQFDRNFDVKAQEQDRMSGGIFVMILGLASAAGFISHDHPTLGGVLALVGLAGLIVAVRAARRIRKLDTKLRLRDELMANVLQIPHRDAEHKLEMKK